MHKFFKIRLVSKIDEINIFTLNNKYFSPLQKE